MFDRGVRVSRSRGQGGLLESTGCDTVAEARLWLWVFKPGQAEHVVVGATPPLVIPVPAIFPKRFLLREEFDQTWALLLAAFLPLLVCFFDKESSHSHELYSASSARELRLGQKCI